MASDSQDHGSSSAPAARSRSSSFADMFARQPVVDIAAANTGRTNAMAQALAQQQQQQQRSRRLSVSALGLSASPTRTSAGQTAFDTLKDKSLASRPRGVSLNADESAVEDGDAVAPLSGEAASRPASPSIARRMSFGAMGYRDTMRSGSGSSQPDSALASDTAGTSPGGSSASPPPSARKEGFNWSETLRTRAQRSSISFSQGGSGGFGSLASGGMGRSQTIPEPAPAAPAPATKLPTKTPDHFQERILKGDF